MAEHDAFGSNKAYLENGIVADGRSDTADQLYPLGTEATALDTNGFRNIFTYCKAGAALTLKQIMRVKVQAMGTTPANQYTVEATAAAGDFVAGAVPVAAITSGNFFWLQRAGYLTAVVKSTVAASGPTAGDLMTASAAAGSCKKYLGTDISHPFAMAPETAADAATTVNLVLFCPKW